METKQYTSTRIELNPEECHALAKLLRRITTEPKVSKSNFSLSEKSIARKFLQVYEREF